MSQTPRDVSVIICTYTEERWSDLRMAIKSVQRQSLAPLEVVVVVDHNHEMYERVITQLTGVIAVENTEQRGLSGARNAGIAVSRGAFIAFLDDDAIAAPDWLARLRAHCGQPTVLGAGGASVPLWSGSQPSWFPDEYAWAVGCSYRGLPTTTAPVRNIYGGCWCGRRQVFEVAGGFRHEVGRVGDRLISCDETEFCVRVGQRWPEGVFLYDPTAVIHHRVPPNRATWSHFRARCYSEGLSKALVTQFVGSKAGLAVEWRYTLRTLPQGVIRGLADTLLRRDATGALRAGAIIAGLFFTTAGYVAGKIAQRGRPSGQLRGSSRAALAPSTSIGASASGQFSVTARTGEG